jgi:dihydrodipicolinate synthase/N-acetylneuraminate lyase
VQVKKKEHNTMKHPKYTSALYSAGFTREPGSDYHYGNPVTGVVLLAGATGIHTAYDYSGNWTPRVAAGVYAAHLDGVPITQHLLVQTILALHHLKTETHNLACTAS